MVGVRKLLPVAAVLLLSLCVFAAPVVAEKRAMTFEDMLRLQSVSGIAVATDGKRVAFVVSGRVLGDNSSWSEVRVLSVKDGKWFKVSADGSHEGSPAWVPDGETLFFTSDKSGKGQVWKSEAKAGGKAVQVTDLATGASAPRVSVDGKRLFFTSRVFPGCADADCNRMNLEEAEAKPVEASVFTKLMYRHWDHWRDGRVSHLHAMPVEGGVAADVMVKDEWGITGGWDLTPDGKYVYYTTKNSVDETLSTNNEIYRIRVDGKEPGIPTPFTKNTGYDGDPVVSPDGQWVAWHSQARDRYESDLFRLTIMQTDGKGEAVHLAPEVDNWVMDYGWFPKSKRLWFAVLEQGRIAVYAIDRKGSKKAKKFLSGGYYSDIGLTVDGDDFFFVKESLTTGAEVWTCNDEGKKGKALTTVNDWLAEEVELAAVEEVWWEGANGDKVHGFVLFPPGTSKDKRNPFLLVIHGGPQGMWSDKLHPRWNAQLFAAPGYVTLLPNPRGSVGYGQKFTEEISRDWGGKCYEDLMKGVDFMLEKGWVDPERMCAGGGSFGGYMANWILGKTDRFKCLFSHAGVYDLRSKYGSTDELWFPEWEFGGTPWDSEDYEKWSPSNLVENFKTPMLVIHGAHDYRVSLNQAMQLFTALQRQKVPSKFLYYPDETHFVVKPLNSQLWYKTLHEWLNEWIGK